MGWVVFTQLWVAILYCMFSKGSWIGWLCIMVSQLAWYLKLWLSKQKRRKNKVELDHWDALAFYFKGQGDLSVVVFLSVATRSSWNAFWKGCWLWYDADYSQWFLISWSQLTRSKCGSQSKKKRLGSIIWMHGRVGSPWKLHVKHFSKRTTRGQY